MGTCLASSECTSQGGTQAGDCAQGFGACCLFIKNECGATIDRNMTYIQNPGFPSQYDENGNTCSYTVKTVSNDVQHLRLDFETFSIKGPSTTFEWSEAGGDCLDSFRVQVCF